MTELHAPRVQPPSSAGLSSSQAQAILAKDGPNELPIAGQRSVFRILGGVVREPMLALLLVGGVAYLLLGDLAEALILLGFATFSVVVTVVQEARTEHVLEALRDLSAPRALVVRDGGRRRVAGREVVCRIDLKDENLTLTSISNPGTADGRRLCRRFGSIPAS